MERLTYKNAKGEWCVKNNPKCAIATCSNDEGRYYIGEPIDRLAELEDELENDTLLKLPAPLGSELWTIKYPTHKHGKETVTVLSDKLATVEKCKYPLSLSNIEMVGKYYFLTREEAEKRLEELKNAERKKV